jgi:ketol-acid reductoisomerase
MPRVLDEIRNGDFARRWIAENDAGQTRFDEMRRQQRAHPVEQVGAELRGMMPWLDARQAPDQTRTAATAASIGG